VINRRYLASSRIELIRLLQTPDAEQLTRAAKRATKKYRSLDYARDRGEPAGRKRTEFASHSSHLRSRLLFHGRICRSGRTETRAEFFPHFYTYIR